MPVLKSWILIDKAWELGINVGRLFLPFKKSDAFMAEQGFKRKLAVILSAVDEKLPRYLVNG